MPSLVGLVNEYVALLLTAATVPVIHRSSLPSSLAAARPGRSAPSVTGGRRRPRHRPRPAP
ncbi:hypothetical protein GCM10018793_45720 [Streptomyces sulfonofaciens]|uniref:Uncharacterized protein n=1 Tax=Streptomyces sulfonofaciens TaxID=68272 RepID=A0A919GGD7_9ACTN|nr:hypothetical protein GCM10018793_45720 [Streptomyces sulfonofaciens]